MMRSQTEKAAARWSALKVATAWASTLTHRGAPRLMRTIYRSLKTEAITLPARSMAEIFPEANHLDVSIRCAGDLGGFSPSEMVHICQIARLTQPANVFEFGTFKGATTSNLAVNTPANAQIFTLDLPASAEGSAALELSDVDLIRKDTIGERFLNMPEAAKITQLFGDSATFDYGPYLGRMDLVIIDASHTYEYVMSDSRIARELLSNHGIIVWQDFPTYPGVFRAVEECVAGWTGGESAFLLGTSLALWARGENSLTHRTRDASSDASLPD